MLTVNFEGFGSFSIEHLVFDFNGTLSVDGKIIEGVIDKINKLAPYVTIHIVTADTYGTVKDYVNELNCRLQLLFPLNQAKQKLDYIQKLDSKKVIAFGNGRNDALMLKDAAIGIAVLQDEGCATETLMNSDITINGVNNALNLLHLPMRLKSTLRA